MGYTLIEVMVAMLLTAIMVTSVFSVALTVKTGGVKSERKLKAAVGAHQVALLLKNYVTADTGAATNTIIPGPCGAADLNWSISCNGIVDACPPPGGSSCYALTPGEHVLTGVLPAAFEAAPYFARVKYTVTGGPTPSVSITTTWTDP